MNNSSNLEESVNSSSQTAPTLKSQLDEIQARADAATEGPWVINDSEQVVRAKDVWRGSILFDRSGESRTEWVDEEQPDATFIARAREDVPKLVAALRAVEAVHRNEHRDKYGRKSEIPTERGDFCFACGWYGGDGCPMITAIREALG